MNNPTLPETGFVRLPAVMAVFPISKSSLYAGIKNVIISVPHPLTSCKRIKAPSKYFSIQCEVPYLSVF